MKRSLRVGGLIVALVAMTGVGATFLGAANAGGARPSVAGTDGVAILRNASGDQMGVIRFTQGAGYVIVRASVAGLTPGQLRARPVAGGRRGPTPGEEGCRHRQQSGRELLPHEGSLTDPRAGDAGGRHRRSAARAKGGQNP